MSEERVILLVCERRANEQQRSRRAKERARHAQIAQLVEQGTENPCVLGSIPSLGTKDPVETSAGFFFSQIFYSLPIILSM